MFIFSTVQYLTTFLINRVILVALKLLVRIINRFLKPFGIQISLNPLIRLFKRLVVGRFAFVADKFYTMIGKRCMIIVISGPPAVGKNTVLHFLMKEFDDAGLHFHFIKSYTTRDKRENKLDKGSYHFVSEEYFTRRISKGQMFEYFVNPNNKKYYGFDILDIKNAMRFRHNSVVIPTYNFLINLRKYLQKNKIKYCDVVSVYLNPRSFDDIKTRIYERQSESPSEIKRRIKSVRDDMATAKYYDFEIINDESFRTANLIKEIVVKEIKRNKNLARENKKHAKKLK